MEDLMLKNTTYSVKHFWRLHFLSLGIGKSLKPLWKNRYKFLFATLIYGIIVSLSIDNFVFGFLPLFFLLFLHLAIVIDLIYTSRKCVEVLAHVQKYTDNSIDMYEMFSIIKEDDELKDDIWF